MGVRTTRERCRAWARERTHGLGPRVRRARGRQRVHVRSCCSLASRITPRAARVLLVVSISAVGRGCCSSRRLGRAAPCRWCRVAARDRDHDCSPRSRHRRTSRTTCTPTRCTGASSPSITTTRSRTIRCTSRAIRCDATSATMWQRTPDIYGLGFTAIMAAAAPVIGESAFRAHFVYQLVAVLAVRRRSCCCSGAEPGARSRSRSSDYIRWSPSASSTAAIPDALDRAGGARRLASRAGTATGARRCSPSRSRSRSTSPSSRPRSCSRCGPIGVGRAAKSSSFAGIVVGLGALPYLFLVGLDAERADRTPGSSAGSRSGTRRRRLRREPAPLPRRRTARRCSRARCCSSCLVRHTSRGTPELALAAAASPRSSSRARG